MPTEIHEKILSYLEPVELGRISSVSSSMQELALPHLDRHAARFIEQRSESYDLVSDNLSLTFTEAFCPRVHALTKAPCGRQSCFPLGADLLDASFHSSRVSTLELELNGDPYFKTRLHLEQDDERHPSDSRRVSS